MKLEVILSQLCLVCGLLVYWSDGKPLDADSIKENMEMAAMNAAGIAMEMAENLKSGTVFNGEFDVDSSGLSSSEEDRKRRRRSNDDADSTALETRQKRSPCGRRRMQTTVATPTSPPGGAAGGGGNDAEDLPRRRRRSVNENDIDENVDIIPESRKFEEDAQQISAKIRQAIRAALENMNEMLEAIGKGIRTAFDKNEKQEPEAM